MSTSTNGQLCYGWVFNEDYSFPWDDYEELNWWAEINGFDEERKLKEYKIYKEWIEKNPIPFELINVCSDSCPIFMIAVPDTLITAWRGDPICINELPVIEQNKIDKLQKLMSDFNIKPENINPGWYLSSYWG